jgi:hypothetical protein
MSTVERESLKEEMRNLVEEARMLLPGIQSLFGFQTIAVFNQRFAALPAPVRLCHLAALAMSVLAMGLVITPAAYHRIAEPGQISQRGVRLSSWLICSGLLPLAMGVALDMYVVILLATDSTVAALSSCLSALLVLLSLWYVFPLSARRRRPGMAAG